MSRKRKETSEFDTELQEYKDKYYQELRDGLLKILGVSVKVVHQLRVGKIGSLDNGLEMVNV